MSHGDGPPKAGLPDLEEDWSTAWVPDVLTWVDYREVASDFYGGARPSASIAQRSLLVPRPAGGFLEAVDLDLADQLALHEAVRELAPLGEAVLAPTVCGYRTGSHQPQGHQGEYARYQELSSALAEDARLVVHADVQSFFRNSELKAVADHLETLLGAPPVHQLRSLAEQWHSRGQGALPAGYSNARLLGNLLLSHADAAIGRPFTRWVDDYRIFVRSEAEAEAVIGRLSTALAELGLALNSTKVSIQAGGQAWNRGRARLASVYHPEHDGPEKSRVDLRALFLRATEDPRKFRRELRFALPRMAELGDDFGVPFAVHMIESCPWDAPRALAYVASFPRRSDVADGLMRIAERAIQNRDAWLTARVMPAVCRRGKQGLKLDLEASLNDLERDGNSVQWGCMLRMLAEIPDHCDLARENAYAAAPPDPRAALAVAHRLGISPTQVPAASFAPATARALSLLREVPLPPVRSEL